MAVHRDESAGTVRGGGLEAAEGCRGTQVEDAQGVAEKGKRAAQEGPPGWLLRLGGDRCRYARGRGEETAWGLPYECLETQVPVGPTAVFHPKRCCGVRQRGDALLLPESIGWHVGRRYPSQPTLEATDIIWVVL